MVSGTDRVSGAGSGVDAPTEQFLLTRDRLYRAAADLFAEQGYDATTMADIAEKAGTSRRTAFNYFPAKSDIPMLWAQRVSDVAVRVIAATANESGQHRLRSYFHQIARIIEADAAVSRQMMLGWTAANGPILYESQLLGDLTRLVDDARDLGEMAEGVDTALVARTLSDVLLGVLFRWVREEGTPLDAPLAAGVDLVLRATESPRG